MIQYFSRKNVGNLFFETTGIAKRWMEFIRGVSMATAGGINNERFKQVSIYIVLAQ